MMRRKLVVSVVFVLLFCVVGVEGKVVGKDLFNISNCYNLTVSPVLESGNESGSSLGFNGCSKIDGDTWFCNCYRNDGLPYHLVMLSDDRILREPRVYDLHLRVNYFGFKVSRQSVEVFDWGDYVDRESLLDVSSQFNYKNSTLEFVTVNHTVYVDRNVTVFQDRTVYKESTKGLDECNSDLNVSRMQAQALLEWKGTAEIVLNNRTVELESARKDLQNCSGELVFLREDRKNYWPWWVSILCVLMGFGIAVVSFSSAWFKKNG